MLEVSDLLELDTKPYVIMGLSQGDLAHPGYAVKFISKSFKATFLNNRLLLKMKNGDGNGHCEEVQKTNQKMQVDSVKDQMLNLEDLVFSKVKER